jgi:ELWxxDGT repeat protein
VPLSDSPQFVALGERVFFRAARGEGPVEIWSTDGTPAGTKPAVTAASGMREPGELIAFGDRLYFAAQRADDLSQRLLPWVSDGTDAGTEPLAEAVLESPSFANPLEEALGLPRFVELNGRVFFAASDPAHGDELWSTDGTPAGTARLLDIAPGTLGAYPRGFAVWRDRLWFRAHDTAHGMELWTSDGTAEGTRFVQDIAPDGAWSTPLNLTPTETGLYFTAHDGVHGRELWVIEPGSGL